MAKAQLVVWALIVGLAVWGYTVLSRVTLPDGVFADLPAAAVVTERPASVAVPAAIAPRAVAEILPAAIPEFPFPDDLAIATVGDPQPVAAPVTVFAAIPPDTIPQISTVADGGMAGAGDPVPAPAVAPVAMEEPPIPMPGRPIVAQPVKADTLAEVRTLYVVADTLNVRAAPSTSGPVLQKVALGFAVAPRQRAADWIGFVMRDGSTGWIKTDYLSDTMPAPVEALPIPQRTEPLNLMM